MPLDKYSPEQQAAIARGAMDYAKSSFSNAGGLSNGDLSRVRDFLVSNPQMADSIAEQLGYTRGVTQRMDDGSQEESALAFNQKQAAAKDLLNNLMMRTDGVAPQPMPQQQARSAPSRKPNPEEIAENPRTAIIAKDLPVPPTRQNAVNNAIDKSMAEDDGTTMRNALIAAGGAGAAYIIYRATRGREDNKEAIVVMPDGTERPATGKDLQSLPVKSQPEEVTRPQSTAVTTTRNPNEPIDVEFRGVNDPKITEQKRIGATYNLPAPDSADDLTSLKALQGSQPDPNVMAQSRTNDAMKAATNKAKDIDARIAKMEARGDTEALKKLLAEKTAIQSMLKRFKR